VGLSVIQVSVVIAVHAQQGDQTTVNASFNSIALAGLQTNTLMGTVSYCGGLRNAAVLHYLLS